MGRPPGTGLMTAARPGTRGGGGFGGALNSQVQVSDRPVTRQGLGGIKTQSQGPVRQVQDKSYWLGILRGKINELTVEIGKLNKNINTFQQENASYVSYEKRAETLAAEIKKLQGENADYNTIIDKLNTNAGFEDLEEDYEFVKNQNAKEAKQIDELFAARQDKEKELKQLDIELNQSQQMTEELVGNMDNTQRKKYQELSNRGTSLKQDLERQQQENDQLNGKIEILEDDLSNSPIKSEAVRLHTERLAFEEKMNQLLDEKRKKESPAEERERLLRQVKEDNGEIARMDNRIKETRERMDKLQDESSQLDTDLEEHSGERSTKYKELKKREEGMTEFLDTFDEQKKTVEDKRVMLEREIVQVLGLISRAQVQTKHMPTKEEFNQIQEDFKFKESEMIKSKETGFSLDHEHSRLQQEVEKIQQLETKIKTELESLTTKINTMTKELGTYSDLNTLKQNATAKKQLLGEEKQELIDKKGKYKNDVQELSQKYDAVKKELADNDTHTQLGNLERKWQHLETNNFAMKEFIAQKAAESNVDGLREEVTGLVYGINQQIIGKLTTGGTK